MYNDQCTVINVQLSMYNMLKDPRERFHSQNQFSGNDKIIVLIISH